MTRNNTPPKLCEEARHEDTAHFDASACCDLDWLGAVVETADTARVRVLRYGVRATLSGAGSAGARHCRSCDELATVRCLLEGSRRPHAVDAVHRQAAWSTEPVQHRTEYLRRCALPRIADATVS